MMVDLKVMAYFKISLSTRNWDRAFTFGEQGRLPNGELAHGNLMVSSVIFLTR
ncbi:hypothetical protein ACEUA0_08710 [Aeromonas veronii]